MNKVIAYVIAFTIVTVVAILPSSTMRTTKSDWYKCIKPTLTPPNFVFPIVWTILYILIAIVLANQIYTPHKKYSFIIYLLFAANLTLNVLWSFAYFGRRNIKIAFVIILLIIISASCIMAFLPYKDQLLFFPYLVWLLFATLLNGISLLYEKNCKTLL